MLKTTRSRETWLFWILALLVLGAGLGLRDPWPADEPRFTLVAKHMVESGDWLFPHRGNELYSDKPPVFMWLQAAAYSVFGNWRVAFMLPSLLAALGTLWCVVDLGKRLWTRRVGLYAGYALLFTLHFTYQAKKAQIDPTVVFWITLANYGLLRHFLRGGDWRMWMLGWFAAGMGTITKGVGALALLMLVPAVLGALRQWPGVVFPRRWQLLLGPLAFVFAVSLWLVPMVTSALHHPDPTYHAYMEDILFRQTAKRYAQSWDHHQPPWYHLTVMASMWLPLLLALPWALPAWKRRLQRRDPRYLLPLLWWALVLLFFSIPNGKRDVYILPALPMACLAFAPLLPGIVRKAWPRRIAFAFAALFALLLTGAGLAMLLGNPGFEAKLIGDRGLHASAAPFAWTLLAMGGGAWAGLLWFGLRRPLAALLSSLAVVWVLYGLLVYPLLNDSSSARGLMTAIDRRLPADAQLGLVAWKEQNLLMAQRPAATFGFRVPWHEQLRQAIAWQGEAPQRRWLLVQEPALSECIDRSKAEFAGRSNRRAWWLVPATAVVPGCRPAAKPDAADPD
ncbi:ArnT family glycosyltransferase [Lysobacter solisilvae (ex Woo and Kim 2020)]|uniref:Glycosyltransferase family 39 protein n=1 Tax=Agrilutibacter terrestris TaxID=2865112 RepID=A0A7H0FUC7_9GAMM|nr:glycosyltransferase family 39 protein [Lysobacter terrestris]QNP39643.1 glycosyltransferase family 39 protein [Lysobacter terrestris]